MQSIRETVASLNSNLEANAGTAAAADANKVAGIFEQVHAFWQRKNVADAMQFSMAAQNGFKTLAEHASAGRFAEASEALAAAQQNCSGCHQAHRERDPAGAWRIKEESRDR
jgi:hypothetical protein